MERGIADGKAKNISGPVKPLLIGSRYFAFFAITGALLIFVFLLNISIGSVKIPVSEILRMLPRPVDKHAISYLIVSKIRLPRAVSALTGGASLAVSGLLLQAFFSNPIVEPYVLGVSSGSTLFVAIVTLTGFTFGVTSLSPMAMFLGAFLGAMAVMSLILVASRKAKSVVTLLIIGMMCGYVCGAATSIMASFAEKERIANFAMWSMGSFSGFSWADIRVQNMIAIPFILWAYTLAKPLNALSMGDSYAISMGVDAKRVRLWLIVISSVLTASVTAFAGPITFVGLAIPHICRILLGTSNNRLLIPASVLGGALMASFCDFMARNAASPLELPLGAVTAVIGAPMVVYLLSGGRANNAASY